MSKDPGVQMRPKRFGIEVTLPPKDILDRGPEVMAMLEERAEMSLLIKLHQERYYCPTPFQRTLDRRPSLHESTMRLTALAYPIRDLHPGEAMNAR